MERVLSKFVLDNIGIGVSDYSDARQFFSLLGFDVTDDPGGTSGMAVQGPYRLWLFSTSGPAPVGRTAAFTENPVGIDHLTFAVDSVDAFCADAISRGLPPREGPMDRWGFRNASFLDPDGTQIFVISAVDNQGV